MKNRLFLVAIISLGLVMNIFAQETKFRKAIFLHRSVGGIVYGSGNVSGLIDTYNSEHNYTGTDAVSMDESTFPSTNTFWGWWSEWSNPNSGLFINYINDPTYKVIIVKECFASQSDIWGYGVPADTGTHEQTILNYQWHCRKILHKMAEHPDKFIIWWDIPPLAYGDEGQAENLKWFNHWMMDTLAAGIDTSFGAVPNNVYFFNYYYYMTDHEQYLFQPAIWTGETSHPNTAGALYVAPYFVNESFDAAINYESNFPASVGFNSINTYSLGQNYPNPFNPSTEINFSLAESGFISLKVYDVSGAEVATLENGFKQAGKYSVKFDAKKYISGIYFYRLNTDNFSSTRKMVLIK